ncbi:acyl-CoA synthetase short-chain family member 3, mitochondrial isoform X2 [Pteropus medius]|uniref:Acyl-CoA synthetase short-chain family member 3, mitochondrial n=1 Tax=Pteropus vampyrus TaxID=132908 RepID=A0A6P3R8H1_PTEVA|nr:acyl-CoA synthetase short-chain family member 3, mitochondrial isoform X2 [Pteropus vampyrus]XP_039694866.1 acyl-CoA synthetase short-chain family member 3, mitochondrial isoform X2 [Pteropus giganteus]
MKPSWLQCRKVTGAGGLGGPLPGSSPARGAGQARRAYVAPGPRGALGGRGCRALSSGGGGGEYKTHFAASLADPERFWGKAAEQISWYKPWTKTLENRHPSTNWFVEGMLNICYNAIDRHIENGKGDKIAIIYDSPVTNTKATITYKEVLEQVSKLAGVLVKHGVKKGDTVVIYMPMIPQAIYTMLSCARIGAIHSLIFGGFASKELSSRIDHAKETVPLAPGRDLDWDEEMAKAQSHDCVPVLSEHPLYILYTSGTTGLPKGVVRPTGGYAVMLNWTMSSVYGLKPGEVWWAASDLGWVVGHSYICYGPLLHGNTTVLYEGKPVGTPDAGAYFRVLAEHGVAALFTAPTAIRAIRQQDPGAALGKQYSLTRFKTLFVAGERCDVETLEWSKKVFRVPVLDHWWQTETGSPITASCIGLGNSKTPPPGQAGKSVPGYNVMVLDDNMQKLKARCLGNIVVKLPLPPGAFSGLWKNQEAFKHLYFEKFPGYYDTMDAGYMDEEGYLYVMSRVDDVINVAGHRISAGAIEESVLSHGSVGDCAVVGKEDPLKGHVPLALCVLREGINTTEEQVLKEILKHVRQSIGPVAAFQNAVFVKQLPKTRSGKIPRSALSALVNGKPYKVTPTIEDPSIFRHIEEVLKKAS